MSANTLDVEGERGDDDAPLPMSVMASSAASKGKDKGTKITYGEMRRGKTRMSMGLQMLRPVAAVWERPLSHHMMPW